MEETNPFRSNRTPPPLPPKPKKFTRSARSYAGERSSSRPPLASPPLSSPPLASPPPAAASTSSTELVTHTQENNKRKLSLSIPDTLSTTLSLSSPPTSSTNLMSFDDDVGNPDMSLSAATCKSPKLVTPGQSRMWAPAICTICMDDLFSYCEIDSDTKSFKFPSSSDGNPKNIPKSETIRPIVSTRCGHLFHTECINKWFMGNMEKEIKECPFCKREMMANDTTRIFPIFEDLF